MDERKPNQQEIEQRVYAEAARLLEITLTETTERDMTEIAPLEMYAPQMHFPEIGLHVTRLWAVSFGRGLECMVLQGIQGGSVVYLAR